MLYPSIDRLLTKLDSKYTLVTVASKRAREMQVSKDTRVEKPFANFPIVLAVAGATMIKSGQSPKSICAIFELSFSSKVSI